MAAEVEAGGMVVEEEASCQKCCHSGATCVERLEKRGEGFDAIQRQQREERKKQTAKDTIDDKLPTPTGYEDERAKKGEKGKGNGGTKRDGRTAAFHTLCLRSSLLTKLRFANKRIGSLNDYPSNKLIISAIDQY